MGKNMEKKIFPIDCLCRSEISHAYLAHAEVYKDAVEDLVEKLDEDYGHHDYGIFPLLFVFRHYLELELMGLILYRFTFRSAKDQKEFIKEARRTHSLLFLWGYLKKIEQPTRVPEDVEWFINNLNHVDSDSSYFRYPEDKTGNRFIRSPKGSPGYVHNERPISKKFYDEITELDKLKTWIDTVINFLRGLEFTFDFYRERYDENEYYKRLESRKHDHE
jgi:hypothetical protein